MNWTPLCCWIRISLLPGPEVLNGSESSPIFINDINYFCNLKRATFKLSIFTNQVQTENQTSNRIRNRTKVNCNHFYFLCWQTQKLTKIYDDVNNYTVVSLAWQHYQSKPDDKSYCRLQYESWGIGGGEDIKNLHYFTQYYTNRGHRRRTKI